MEVEQLKDDVRQGRIGIDQLIDAITSAVASIAGCESADRGTRKASRGLEKKLGAQLTTKFDQPFSLRAEREQRQAARGKKSRKRQATLAAWARHDGREDPAG